MNVSWHCHCLTLAYLEKQAHQKTNNIMQQNKKRYDSARMPRFLHYSNFLNGRLILGLDLSFYKCAILTCRRSVKRISWNKVLQRWHFCDKTLPFSKTILRFLSLVWWESQFTVQEATFFSESGSNFNCLFSNVCCNEESLGHSKKQKADLSCIESESAKSTNSPKNLWSQSCSNWQVQ